MGFSCFVERDYLKGYNIAKWPMIALLGLGVDLFPFNRVILCRESGLASGFGSIDHSQMVSSLTVTGYCHESIEQYRADM